MELWMILLIVGIVLFVLTFIMLILVFKRRKNNTQIEDYSSLITALGDKDNINSVSFKGSRISVEVKDKKLINKEAIKVVSETIVVSNSKITMVAGEKSESIFNYLNKQING